MFPFCIIQKLNGRLSTYLYLRETYFSSSGKSHLSDNIKRKMPKSRIKCSDIYFLTKSCVCGLDTQIFFERKNSTDKCNEKVEIKAILNHSLDWPNKLWRYTWIIFCFIIARLFAKQIVSHIWPVLPKFAFDKCLHFIERSE